MLNILPAAVKQRRPKGLAERVGKQQQLPLCLTLHLPGSVLELHTLKLSEKESAPRKKKRQSAAKILIKIFSQSRETRVVRKEWAWLLY